MTLQEVITKAIEGGYNTHGWVPGEYVSHDAECITFLDPLFWKSLGKAMEWENNVYVEGKGIRDVKEWKQQWHRFIDHLAEGKDAESFFESLTNHNT